MASNPPFQVTLLKLTLLVETNVETSKQLSFLIEFWSQELASEKGT